MQDCVLMIYSPRRDTLDKTDDMQPDGLMIYTRRASDDMHALRRD